MSDLMTSAGGGYHSRELLHRRGDLAVARGTLIASGQPVIIKRVTQAGCHGLAAAHLRFEYAMLQRAAPQPVPEIAVPVGWYESPVELALILQDQGGDSLQSLTRHHSLGIDTLIHIAQGVARALHHVHAAGMVHRAVNPGNIVYNPRTGSTQLIDFGQASPNARELPEVENVHTLAAELPFIAPEQTGLGPRAVDARSDFYALGMTLYKLLAGLFPYPQQDITSWIAALLTQDPPNLRMHVPEIPACLAAVVAKLLCKAPEGRYQSARGLEIDLQQCASALAQEQPGEFDLGRHDTHAAFYMPQQLFGREVALSQLKTATARARTGSAVPVLVVGAEGTGKTALLAEERRWAFLEGGLCLRAPHDALHAAVPLNGVARALAQLVRFIGAEPEDVALRWSEVLRHAAGDLGAALVEVVPTLRPLLGPLLPLPEAGPAECRRRLLGCLQRFILAACEVQPITLVLDDMQWADSATLQLLPHLLRGPRAGRGLAVVCAVQVPSAADASAAAVQPVRQALRQSAVALATLELPSLDAHSLQGLLSAALGGPPPPALHAWVRAQTHGVPLRVHRLLLHAAHQGNLQRSPRGGWELPVASMPGQAPGMLAQHVACLPAATQRCLAAAACCGGDFRLTLLAEALQSDRASSLAALAPALAAGLVAPVGAAHRLASFACHEVLYRFVHPAYGAAARMALPQEARQALHASVGALLLQQQTNGHPSVREFMGVVHCNAAAPCTDPARRLQLARLNLRMGCAAKHLAGLQEAADFLRRAESLLMPQTATQPAAEIPPQVAPLHHAIMLHLAEAEYLTGAPGAAEQRLDALLAATVDPLARANIYRQRCVIYAHEDFRQIPRGIAAGLAGLQALGVRVRSWPPRVEAYLNRRSPAWAPTSQQVQALLCAPAASDPRANAVATLCEVLGPLCFFTRPALFRRLLRVRLRCLLRWGTVPAAAGTYGGLTLLLMRCGRHAEARAVSEAGLALDGLAEQHPSAHLACTVMHTAAVEWLAAPSADMLRNYRKAFARCQEQGDVILPGFFAVQDTYLAGMVSQARVAVREARYACLRLHSGSVHGFCLQALAEINRGLRGDASVDTLLEYQHQAEQRHGYAACMFYACMAQMHTLGNQSAHAVQCGLAALRHGAAHHLPEHVQAFFALFAGLAAIERRRAPGRRRATRRLLRWCMRCLQRAAAAPGSLWSGPWLLLRAYQEADAGHTGAAARLYERANEALPQIGASLLVALGWECVGRFYLQQGLRSAAQLYLCKARCAYQEAAPAKVRRIEEEFPGLLTEPPEKVDIDLAAPTYELLYTYQRQAPAPLRAGFLHVQELTESLRSQATLEALEDCVCDLLLRHGGATRVVLAREMGGGVVPVVQRSTHDNGEGPIADLPVSVLNYTVRSGETVLINDALVNEFFSRDPYLVQTQPRSLASVAVYDGARVCGVAYLENTLLSQAFGPDCMAFVSFVLGEAGPRVAALPCRAAHDGGMTECAAKVAREAWQALEALRGVACQHATLEDVQQPLERVLKLTEQLGARPQGDLSGQGAGAGIERNQV